MLSEEANQKMERRKEIRVKIDELVNPLENIGDVMDFVFELRLSMKEWLKEHHTINRKDPAWNLINNVQQGIKFSMNSNLSDISLSSILAFNSEMCELIKRYYGDEK